MKINSNVRRLKLVHYFIQASREYQRSLQVSPGLWECQMKEDATCAFWEFSQKREGKLVLSAEKRVAGEKKGSQVNFLKPVSSGLAPKC